MAPPAILLLAERLGLTTIGLTDHSSAGNAAAFLAAAQAFAVTVLVGLEIESAEGVHLLALFTDSAAATALERYVSAHQPVACNRPEVVGHQWLLDEYGELVEEETRLLIAATDLTAAQIVTATHDHDGLSVAAHIDRRSNGLLSVLGFIPPKLAVDLFELSPHLSIESACHRWPGLTGRPLLQSSDAHYLGDLGKGATPVPEALARPTGPLREWGRQLAAALVSQGCGEP